MPTNKEKRKAPRLILEKPFCAQARIVQIDGNSIPVNANIGKICIMDISAGGMCILSPFKISATYENGQRVIVEIKTRISEAITLWGQILWREELPSYMKYGLQFNHGSLTEKNLLQTLINNATTVINTDDKVSMILGYDFCDKSPEECFCKRK